MQKTARLPRQSVAMKQSRRRENIAGYLFMAPSLLFFLGFVIFPMVMCLVYSFTDYTMTSFSFAGFDNYKRMFQDAIFGKALWNTIILVIISVPVTTSTEAEEDRPDLAGRLPVHTTSKPAGSV